MARFVLAVLIVALVFGGAIAAAVVALETSRTTIAVVEGAGVALGAWSAAALLALVMEMADSLRDLARSDD